MKTYWLYILTNSTRSTQYIGITNDLDRRLIEHTAKSSSGFTAKYNCNYLIYYEETNDVEAAIAREKQLKKWSRSKKDAVIDTLNPNREDLSASVEMTRSKN